MSSQDNKRKRWTSCGVCTACLATDCGAKRPRKPACAPAKPRLRLAPTDDSLPPRSSNHDAGECINCLDKSKFGGQGSPLPLTTSQAPFLRAVGAHLVPRPTPVARERRLPGAADAASALESLLVLPSHVRVALPLSLLR